MGIRTAFSPFGGSSSAPYEPEAVIFESAIPGEYPFKIPQNCVINIRATGGGGRGNTRRGGRMYCATGGSSAGFDGEVFIKKGFYTIVVGASNQDTSLSDILVCGKGENAPDGAIAGTGGILTVLTPNVVSSLISANGLNGYTMYSSAGHCNAPNSPLNMSEQYGKGGDAETSGRVWDGNSGYMKITYKRLKP